MSTIPEGQQDRPSPRPIGTGAYPRELAQFALPMRPTTATTWSRSNGDFTYTVTAATMHDANNQPYQQMPSGKYARAALFYLFSYARWSADKKFSLGANPSEYLKLASVPKSGTAHREALRQLELVARAQFTVRQVSVIEDTAKGPYESEQLSGGILAEDLRLWTPLAEGKSEKLTSSVVISRYFEQMVDRAVPIPRSAWRYLMEHSKSALPLDVYVWLCHRLYHMPRESRISWTQLHQQFGFVSEVREFKRKFRAALKLVEVVYPEARITEEKSKSQRKGFSGFLLRPGSPEPIASAFHDSL